MCSFYSSLLSRPLLKPATAADCCNCSSAFCSLSLIKTKTLPVTFRFHTSSPASVHADAEESTYMLQLSSSSCPVRQTGALPDFQMWKSPCLWPFREPGSPLKASFCISHVRNLIIGSFTLQRRRLQAELGGANAQPSNKKLPGLVFLFWFEFVVLLNPLIYAHIPAPTVTSAAAQFTE